jgi:hypothetical protein
VTPRFDATFGGSVNDAGQALLNCAVAAGFGTQTHLHGAGGGACWIAANVGPMLASRVVRANDDWEKYWDNLTAAVAA